MQVGLRECNPCCGPPLESVHFNFPTLAILLLKIPRGFFDANARAIVVVGGVDTGGLIFREKISKVNEFAVLNLLKLSCFNLRGHERVYEGIPWVVTALGARYSS